MYRIKRTRLFLLALGVFAGFAFLGSSNAEDLSALQSAASYAWKDMDNAKTLNQANNQEVILQQQVVEDKKRQLAEEEKRLEQAINKAAASQKHYLEARKKYEKAQSALDNVWDKKK